MAESPTTNRFGEERRIVTVLFSDVVGSTSLAEKMDPEDWGEVMATVQAVTGRIIQAHGGQVIQYQGDGLIALFGVRTPTERDAENAVRAGLEIQSTSIDVPVEHFQMRIGIHTGLVVVGQIGSEARREYAALGDAMNLAARMQTAAPNGGVLISHDTYRHVRGVFELTAQPPIALKGKSEPVQTYVVHRAKPRHFRAATRGVAGVETRTVGRAVEIEQLRQAAAKAWNEHRVVWTQLVGEPGIGKSHLMQDTWEHLELQGVGYRLFRARAAQGDESQAFGLARRMWFDRFQIAEDMPLAEAQSHWLEQFLGWRGPAYEEEAHALGLLLGLPFADSPHIRGMRDDPAQLKGRALVVSRALLSTARAESPIAILLEDLHWADPSSVDYLVQLFRDATEDELPAGCAHGVFVLATARPEWQIPSRLADHPDYVQVNLGALPPQDCHALVSKLFERVEGVPEAVTAEIVTRSEGVPYFCEEMMNWFLDRGIINRQSETWRFDAAQLQRSPLPETLQHLLLTRLAALDDAERAALQRGAIFGRNFWEGGLDALGATESRVALERAQSRNLVHRQSESILVGDVEWSFQHALLHEVTYESVLKRERREWHRAAGHWLEAQARRAGRLDEFAQVLGMHAEQAGGPGDRAARGEAADWYLCAADHARERAAMPEAQRLYERVLRLVPEDDVERRWSATRYHWDVLSHLGNTAALKERLADLLELAKQMGDSEKAIALSRHGLFQDRCADYAAAVPLYETAYAAAVRAGNHELAALILGWKAACQTRLGDLEGARGTTDDALALLRETDERTTAKVISNLAVYYVAAGDAVTAAVLRVREAEIGHRVGDRGLEANALGNLGYIELCLGLTESGRQHLEQTIGICQALGMRRELLYTRLNLGLAHWRAGDGHQARAVLEALQNDLAAFGDRFAIAAGLCYLGLALELEGDADAAAACLLHAHEIYTTIGVRGDALDALAGMARAAHRRGDGKRAHEYALDVWAQLQAGGPQGMEFPVRAYHICAEIFGACGEFELAHAAIAAGYREFSERAARISNPEWRKSYAERLPEHRAVTEWHQREHMEDTQNAGQDYYTANRTSPGTAGNVYDAA